MEYNEYHSILAKMIQTAWKNYILQKKKLIKPEIIERKAKEAEVLDEAFGRIHATTTHFKTMVVTFTNELAENTKLSIGFDQNNRYSTYDERSEKVFIMNRKQVGKKLKTINNILSIKLEAIVTNLNHYGYPEIVQVKLY